MFGQSTTTTTTTTAIDNQMTNAPLQLSLLSFWISLCAGCLCCHCLACHTSSFRIVASQCVHWSVCKWQIKPGDWSSLVRSSPVRSISMPATEVSANENEKCKEKWQRELLKGHFCLMLRYPTIYGSSNCCFSTCQFTFKVSAFSLSILPSLSLSLTHSFFRNLYQSIEKMEMRRAEVKIASISATFAPRSPWQ